MTAKRNGYSAGAQEYRHCVANCLVATPQATTGKEAPMCVYNLFRHKNERHLVCAVPQDCTVPEFIAGEAWEFDRTVTEGGGAPIGFDTLAAAHGGLLNGFYLLQTYSE
jgi:hypothetical protein